MIFEDLLDAIFGGNGSSSPSPGGLASASQFTLSQWAAQVPGPLGVGLGYYLASGINFDDPTGLLDALAMLEGSDAAPPDASAEMSMRGSLLASVGDDDSLETMGQVDQSVGTARQSQGDYRQSGPDSDPAEPLRDSSGRQLERLDRDGSPQSPDKYSSTGAERTLFGTPSDNAAPSGRPENTVPTRPELGLPNVSRGTVIIGRDGSGNLVSSTILTANDVPEVYVKGPPRTRYPASSPVPPQTPRRPTQAPRPETDIQEVYVHGSPRKRRSSPPPLPSLPPQPPSFQLLVDIVNDTNRRTLAALEKEPKPFKDFDVDQFMSELDKAIKQHEEARIINAGIKAAEAAEAKRTQAEIAIESQMPGTLVSVTPIVGSALRGIVHAQHGNYGRASLYGVLAISDIFLVKSLVVGGGRLALGGLTRLTVNAEMASTRIAGSFVRSELMHGASVTPTAIVSDIAPKLTYEQGYNMSFDLAKAGYTEVLGKFPGNIRYVEANIGTFTIDRPWGWTRMYNAGGVRGALDAGGRFAFTSTQFTGTFALEAKQVLGAGVMPEFVILR